MNLNDTIISLSTLWKKIKINSHSNFEPFKNMKVRHFIWGFNKFSFEISTEYERMCNFRPKELKRYNYFIIYAMKKIKIKSLSNLRPFKNMIERHFIWGFNKFCLKFQPSTDECIIFGRKNLNDTIFSFSTL
jgi:hypothetical protein